MDERKEEIKVTTFSNNCGIVQIAVELDEIKEVVANEYGITNPVRTRRELIEKVLKRKGSIDGSIDVK